MKKALTIKNDIKQLPCIYEFLQETAHEAGIEESICMNIRLAVEEAVVNVISYAYPDEKDKNIDISIEQTNGDIIITITDSGIPFDPTAKQDPDILLPLEERPIGGLGTFLVKQLMTDVSYTRSGGKNILTMTKKMN